MYPTRTQVKTKFLIALNDPAGVLFDVEGISNVFQPAFSAAYNTLFTSFLNHQCPRIELITSVIVPPLTTSLTPANMGIADFGDIIHLRERTPGSNDKFIELRMTDDLTQRPMADRLLEFSWRANTFWFIGCTTVRELEIKYDSSGQAPTDDSTAIMVDNCDDFLASYAVGIAGLPKGYEDLAERAMTRAVGSRFDEGVLGGLLLQLIQPLVRSRQHVQIAHKPYSTWRRFGTRAAVPYVAAQVGTTGGTSMNTPVQFSTANGTIVGTLDGVNRIFWLTIGGVKGMSVAWNGVTQTPNVDYTALNNQITFAVSSIPQPSDIITADAYLQ